MSESASTVEAPTRGLPPTNGELGFFQKYGAAIIFLAPTLVLLGVWVVYPTIRTIIRSFYDREGDAEYFQVYTSTIEDRFFFEIVERRGYRGYGAVNAPIRLAAQARLGASHSSRSS